VNGAIYEGGLSPEEVTALKELARITPLLIEVAESRKAVKALVSLAALGKTAAGWILFMGGAYLTLKKFIFDWIQEGMTGA
jgi:hypothetical protein